MTVKFPNVASEYTKFIGGLDLETPSLSIFPGKLLSTLNYECGTNGGYRRIDGYERYDGQPSPSDAVYYYCQATITGTISVGDIITGVSSGATGIIINILDNHFNITKVTGVFEVEDFTVAAVIQGSIDVVPSQNGEDTAFASATALNLAADEYRNDINAPTGSGPVRGIEILRGIVYAWRDNVGATACNIFKATSAGWVQVGFYATISFDTGVLEISDGDSITQLVSGATADVKRVVLESGTWSGGDATGRLVLDNIVGVFNNSDIIQVGAVNAVTSTSLTTAITISPGGRYQTIVTNFGGQLDTKRIYGCDNVNSGFEFDGDIYVPINTGMVVDVPEEVWEYKQQLFFSFKSSSQNSGIGEPYQWTPVTGASEIAVGDTITGYKTLPGKALAIFSRNSSHQLLGNNITDFDLDGISDEVGCIKYTSQRIGQVFILDDRGIVAVDQSDTYGNFAQNTVSRVIQPIIDTLRTIIVASTVYRSRDQYRLYGSDGSGIIMTKMDDGSLAFTRFEYPDVVSCIISGEDANGKDVVFFGTTDGLVCQADKGSSFDGEDIEHFLQLQFNNSKSPTVLKTYKKATIEMKAEAYTALRYSPEFSYADINRPAHNDIEIMSQGAGGYWDAANWDEFFYDSKIISTPSFRIDGSGTNLGIVIYGKSSIDQGHKIDGAIIHYIKRRLVR